MFMAIHNSGTSIWTKPFFFFYRAHVHFDCLSHGSGLNVSLSKCYRTQKTCPSMSWWHIQAPFNGDGFFVIYLEKRFSTSSQPPSTVTPSLIIISPVYTQCHRDKNNISRPPLGTLGKKVYLILLARGIALLRRQGQGSKRMLIFCNLFHDTAFLCAGWIATLFFFFPTKDQMFSETKRNMQAAGI